MNILRRSFKTWEFWSIVLPVGSLVYLKDLFPLAQLSVVLIVLLNALIVGRSLYKYSRDVGIDRKYLKFLTAERICSLAGWVWLVYAFRDLNLEPSLTLWLVMAHGSVYAVSVSFGKSSGVKTQVISI